MEGDCETPAHILGEREPFAKELIDKISSKWTKRTKEALVRWPEGGTFDVDRCENMRALILNHKQKDHGKKRQEKQSLEIMVLSKFYTEARER